MKHGRNACEEPSTLEPKKPEAITFLILFLLGIMTGLEDCELIGRNGT